MDSCYYRNVHLCIAVIFYFFSGLQFGITLKTENDPAMPPLAIPSKDILEHVHTGIWMDQRAAHKTVSNDNVEIMPMFIHRNLHK